MPEVPGPYLTKMVVLDAKPMISYRPDIDGLRALAVGLVVLFHAGLSFSGGYIGVDVFFVISGYLITSKLLADHQSGKASVARFYSARAKRILPALLVMNGFCIIVGWMLLLPIDFAELSWSTVSSALFSSNFYFYSLSGYFDGPAIEKPLLHTWSLAVEEQFYLVWPLICLCLLFRAAPRRQVSAIIGAAAVSFVLAQYLIVGDRSAAFFFPITRAWELLAGAIVAMQQIKLPPRMGEPLSLLSLATIVASGLLLTSGSDVPGWSAIPPVAAATILVVSGPHTIAARALAFEPVRRVGLISYSLYLWHWPLLAFFRYYLERDLTPWESIAAIAVSFVVSALSWAYVEQVRRYGGNSRRVLISAAAGLFATAAVGVVGISAANVDTMSTNAREAMHDVSTSNPLTMCHRNKPGPINTSSECLIGAKSDHSPDFVLIGDSHGDHFAPALNTAAERLGLTGIQITRGGGCAPVWGIHQISNSREVPGCDDYRSDVLRYIDGLPSNRLIVIAARWSLYLRTTAPNIDTPFYTTTKEAPELSATTSRRNIIEHLRSTVAMFRMRGHRVMVVDQVPEYAFFPLNCYVRHADQANAGEMCGEVKPTASDVKLAMEAAKESGALVIHPTDFLCGKSGRCTVAINGSFLYRDIHHLNRKGSLQMASWFERALSDSRAD